MNKQAICIELNRNIYNKLKTRAKKLRIPMIRIIEASLVETLKKKCLKLS